MFGKKRTRDAATSGSTAPKTAPKAAPRRAILAAGVALLLAIAVGGTLIAGFGDADFRSMLARFTPGSESPDSGLADDPALPPAAELMIMPFEEMIVNIADISDDGQQIQRFMRLDFALVYDTIQDAESVVEARYFYMRDAFQDYLRQLSVRDIDGAHGLLLVRNELLRRARAIAGNDAPQEVLVMELLVQ